MSFSSSFWLDRSMATDVGGDTTGDHDLDTQPQLSSLSPTFHPPPPPPEIFAGASPESLRSALVGKTVTAARRHGKNLWLELEQGGGGAGGGGKAGGGAGGGGKAGGGGQKGKAASTSASSPPPPPSSSPSSAALMLHFGMTGSFPVRGAKRVVYVNEGGSAKKGKEEEEEAEEEDDEEEGKSSPAEWPPRFCKLELSLSPGDVRVAYCDPRRFGRVQVVRPASDVAQRIPAGRDILNDPLSPQDLAAELAKVNRGKAGRALKTVLMEQSFLAGVGNWVADEVRGLGLGVGRGGG